MGRKGSNGSEAARAAVESARARLAELDKAIADATNEYQEIGRRFPSAGAAEVAKHSARRGELERLHRDLGIASDSARRDRDAAEEAYALARLPEVLEERNEAMGKLDAALREALPGLRKVAAGVATITAEIGSLRFPPGRERKPEPGLLTPETVLAEALTRTLYGGDGESVEVVFKTDYHATRPPAPLLRKHYVIGTRMKIPPGTAEVLRAEGVVEIVAA